MKSLRVERVVRELREHEITHPVEIVHNCSDWPKDQEILKSWERHFRKKNWPHRVDRLEDGSYRIIVQATVRPGSSYYAQD